MVPSMRQSNSSQRRDEIQRHQYKERRAINCNGSRFNNVPHLEMIVKLSDTNMVTDTAYHLLFTNTTYLYGEAPQESPERKLIKVKGYSIGCSNGNASGNTIEEALLQGLLELPERSNCNMVV